MGNDGGDIPKRRQLVKDRKKVQLPNRQAMAIGRSRYCNLTHEKLKLPLAVCRLGYIYNYENVLEALVKKQLPLKYSYIRKLNDIRKIEVDKTSSESQNFFCCPITKIQYNGFNKFVAFWSCGHVLSRKAFQQIKIEDKVCLVCLKPYQPSDVIDLNLEGQQFELLRKKLIERNSKKKEPHNEEEITHEPEKKIKTEAYISSLDRLGGEFRDVIRERQNFKKLFQKIERDQEWQTNTFMAKKEES